MTTQSRQGNRKVSRREQVVARKVNYYREDRGCEHRKLKLQLIR